MKFFMEICSLAKKSVRLTQCLFSAASPIHSPSPIIRSHSLLCEFISLMKRAAKLVQGTNSNFISIPLSLVKSLLSSTSALAGSQAAQHRVSDLPCAAAGLTPKTPSAAAASAVDAKPLNHVVRPRMFVSSLVKVLSSRRRASAGNDFNTWTRPDGAMTEFEREASRIFGRTGLASPPRHHL